MEPIITIIIMAILSALFKGKGKDKKETPVKGQPKPFTATGRVPDNPQSKLKEMSKELYRELQKEMQRKDEEPPSRQLQPSTVPQPAVTPLPIAPEPVVEITPAPAPIERAAGRPERPESPRERQRERHSGRLSTHGGQRQSPVHGHELMPKSEQDFLKGIIFSEILGPPKSKR